MEGGEDSEYETRELKTSFEMFQAAGLSVEMVRIIRALEEKILATGCDESLLWDLKERAWAFCCHICRMTNYGSELETIKFKSALEAVTVDMKDMAIGMSDDEIVERTVQRLTVAIMAKYEAEARDLPEILEEKKIQATEVALRFGFNLEVLGKDIDELRHELWKVVSSFSIENKQVQRIMTMLAREPCLSGIAKLRWILEEISMLRGQDLDIDSEIKSTTLNLKSATYLSGIENEESCSKGIAGDKNTFAAYRLNWERSWGYGYSFENMTLLSPMQFTHCMPSRVPVDAVAGSTLQIYSIKVSTKGFAWPLEVYGVVTARDSVDHQRNPIFIRTRNYCQVLTEKDPFLRLTGPVRAIVATDRVYIETELKKKGRRKSEDLQLAATVISSFKGDNLCTPLADNDLCTIELCFENLEHSVQATIVSIIVRSKPPSVPFPYGGKITCYSISGSGNGYSDCIPSRQAAVVFDSVDGKLVQGRNGHLDLSRRVFSVELGGRLQFDIQRYSRTHSVEIDARVLFTAKKWNFSKHECCLDDGSEVEIIIAWSLLPSKM